MAPEVLGAAVDRAVKGVVGGADECLAEVIDVRTSRLHDLVEMAARFKRASLSHIVHLANPLQDGAAQVDETRGYRLEVHHRASL